VAKKRMLNKKDFMVLYCNFLLSDRLRLIFFPTDTRNGNYYTSKRFAKRGKITSLSREESVTNPFHPIRSKDSWSDTTDCSGFRVLIFSSAREPRISQEQWQVFSQPAVHRKGTCVRDDISTVTSYSIRSTIQGDGGWPRSLGWGRRKISE
jgi:hypothetical protein